MKTYLTSCVQSTAELIDAMVDASTEVTLEEFREECDCDEWEKEAGYESDASRGLTLADDWHVTYHRSVYNGQDCMYIRHSCIEYIFT